MKLWCAVPGVPGGRALSLYQEDLYQVFIWCLYQETLVLGGDYARRVMEGKEGTRYIAGWDCWGNEQLGAGSVTVQSPILN